MANLKVLSSPAPTHVQSGSLRLTLLAAAFSVSGCAANAPSRPAADGPQGYLMATDNRVVRSGGGECVRTGFWQPSDAIAECDPALVARTALPPAEKPAETTTAAPEEAPPTQAEAAPAPAEPIRVYVGADAFFAFDQAELTPRAKNVLDRIAGRARNAKDASIRLVGYADQVGSEDYNFFLSERRAEAVQAYLLEQRVPATAVSVEARGENDPIVSCEGRQGEALIECLQPNRRTEIELSLLESPS